MCLGLVISRQDEITQAWMTYSQRGSGVIMTMLIRLLEGCPETAGLELRTTFMYDPIAWKDHVERYCYRERPRDLKFHPVAVVLASLFVGNGGEEDCPQESGRRLCYMDFPRKMPEEMTFVLAPQTTQVGDFICWFDSDQMLFVLRPANGRDLGGK